VILDAAAPELDGLAMANRVHRAAARTRTILLSMDARSDELRELRAAGVAGYLLSTAGRDELESAVRAVARGKAWYASRLTRRGFGQRNVRHLPAASPLPLTPRLRDVLRMLAEGLSSKEIGLRLGVSARTVEKHRAMLMQRLDIHSLAGLVRYAIRAGIAR
jgi:DNA-binding NarL/FixJ family response regulator